MPLPLSGLLVVSLEQAVAAPMCTCRLADAGARVIKVERPEGDFARYYDKLALPSPGAKRRGEGSGVGVASESGETKKEPPPLTPPHNAKTRWGRGTDRARGGRAELLARLAIRHELGPDFCGVRAEG